MAQTTSEGTLVSDEGYLGNHQVYVPYRAGLPPLRTYVRELWRRREFLNELAASNIRMNHMDTVFGRLWNLLNPLLVGATFFMLIVMLGLRGGSTAHYFCYIMSGLFFFGMIQESIQKGTGSVVSNKSMITSVAFPKALLTIAGVRESVLNFLPTLPVLFVIALIAGVRPMWTWICVIPLVLLAIAFMTGAALLAATAQVYFRDTRNMLPHIVRIWMYASPIIWTPETLSEKLKIFFSYVNPIYCLVTSYNQAVTYGQWPPLQYWLIACAWSFSVLILGCYLFLTRERDFAIRV